MTATAARDRRVLVGAAMIVGSAACFATLPTLAKVAFDHGGDTHGVLLLRFVVAAPVVGVWVWRRRSGEAIRRAMPLIVPGAVLYMLQTLTFFEAVDRMGAVLSVLILFAYPLIVAVAAPFAVGEPFGLARLGIVIVGSIGVALSIGYGGHPSTAGVLLASASAVLFAAFFLVVKRALEIPGVDGLSVTALVYVVCVLGFAVLALVGGASLPRDGGGWLAVAGIATFGTIMATVLLFVGMSRLSASAAGLLTAVEPPLSVLLAAVALAEPVHRSQIAGMALLAAAVLALGRSGLTAEIPER
jgi:drug/metabolite transporter (DMT)-like permease